MGYAICCFFASQCKLSILLTSDLYQEPGTQTWFALVSSDYWWNRCKSRYLQHFWRNSVLHGRFNFSHFRWQTMHIWYHWHII